MLWGERPDGVPLRKVPALRRMLAFLMPRRSQAEVFLDQQVDVTDTLAWLARQPAGERKITFFHVFLAACIRTLAEKPAMHRFVSGGRLYQRKRIEVSFVVKKVMDESSAETTVKVAFEPTDTLADVVRRVDEQIAVGRGKRATSSEKEMAFFTRLPGPLLSFAVWAQRKLDAWNLLPAFMTQDDPMYASLFVANLGSVGLEAPFHHLYDYGTIPFFGTIGRIRKEARVMPDGSIAARDLVSFRWTFDERIADGYLAARSLDRAADLVRDPDPLTRPPAHLPDPFA